MFDFTFYNPVKIFFGKGQIAELENAISKDKNILLTMGGGSIKRNGVYDQVLKALKGHKVVEFSGIEPNPHYETLMKAVKVVKEKNIDFILSVGGGSVLDGTKFIAAAAKYEHDDCWNIMKDWESVKDAVPLGAVLTLPATGSEMNCGSVVTRAETKEKLAFINPHVFPVFSILDPETTFTLPEKQTVNGIIDTFVHTTEQYLTYPVDAPLQDRWAEGILLTLIEEAPKVLKNPNDYNTRANIMWTATMALNGIIAVGVPQDWATHTLGHEITAKCGLDHGHTLAIVLPSLLKVKAKNKSEKLLQYASRIWGIDSGSQEERVQKAIDKTGDFFESLGVKIKFGDYGITDETIDEMVSSIKNHGFINIGERQDITLDEIKEIYNLSK